MHILIKSMVPLVLSGSVFAADPSLNLFLQRFHKDPHKMINLIPPEVKNGKVLSRGFLNDEAINQDLIDQKESLRQKIRSKAAIQTVPSSVITDNEHPAALVDGTLIANIFDLDRRGLLSAKLPYSIWSDSYWPISKGLLAIRYADGFSDTHNWSANYAHFLANPTSTVSTDILSPAEKYDLLVSDPALSLTNFSWRSGQEYIARYGHVPSWMGICHGWSGATHMRAAIPFGSVVLTSAQGRQIRFYQSDVKALQSLLWGEASPPTRFLGYRCDKNPPRDDQGRITDEKCNDTNAASFYLTLTNQIGINKRSFVMDSVFDSQVWNFSVISYRGIYFNPQTLQQTSSVKQALVPVHQFTIDKFKKHRSPGTAYIIGVTMDVTHLNESPANHRVQTEPKTKTVRYVYDLELDPNYNVIGGEWYTRIHPDFVWTYAPNAQAMAPGDSDINFNDWNVNQPVPASWTQAAQRSSRKGVPLFSVIRKIIEAAPKAPAPSGN